MIELLGVGVPARTGGWLLRRVGIRMGRELAIVVSARAEERRAIFDVVAGRVIPAEGRAWIGGVPLTPKTRPLIRKLVAEVHDASSIARALLDENVEYLLLHDLDLLAGPEEVERTLGTLETVRRSRQVGAIVTMVDAERARRHAERLIVLADGRIVSHEVPSAV